MLFNAHSFIFLFLPITLLVYHWLSTRYKATYAIGVLWLVGTWLFGSDSCIRCG